MTKRLMIMAAGTGGHIFPGLAIAKTMQARGWEVTWLGTRHGMEGDIVAKNGIAMDMLDFEGVRGKGWRHATTGVLKLVASFWRCFQILKQQKPDVVIGMGGYVTVPGGLMATLRGIPLVVVNADAAWLLSTKVLAPFAKRVLMGFAGHETTEKIKVTGNPVRSDIAALAPPQERFAGRGGPLRIVIIGGSLGAKALNDTVPKALALLPTTFIVKHQSGKQHIDALRARYEQIEAEVVPFIDDMASEYARADLVICRAGAMTVAELTAAGVGSILIPFMASSTTHQRDNANWMAAHHAAIHLPQSELSPETLAKLLRTITREKCLAMGKGAYQLGQRHASEAIADELESIGSKKT